MLDLPRSVNQDQLNALETRALSLARAPRPENLETFRPLFVEFAGSPKSGKSTVIDNLHHFFRRMGFTISAQTEGASKRTPSTLKDNLIAFNTWSLNYAISEMLLASNSIPRSQLVLLDRGPFDVVAWMQLLTKGKSPPSVRSHLLRDIEPLTAKELRAIEDFAMHPRWRKMISRLYIFICATDVSLERETRAKLTKKPGRTMNPEVLDALRDKYSEIARRFADVGVPLRMIDTTNVKSAQVVAYGIAKDLLDEITADLSVTT